MQRRNKREREEGFDLAALRQAAANAGKPTKAAEDMIEAIKLDIVTAIRAHATPLVFIQELIDGMQNESPLAGTQALLNRIDCGYGDYLADDTKFNSQDYNVIYYHLMKIIGEQYEGADKLSQQEVEQKAAASQQAQQAADKVLKKLGCNRFTRNALLQKFEKNPFQLHMLNTEYNTVMVQAVKDQPSKQALIEKLMEVGSEAKSKRQRYNLCPAKYNGSVLSWLQERMSELEYLFFTLEGVQDDVLVLETVNENRELFERGMDVADCCKVIPEHLCLDVMDSLIDEDCDAKYTVEALGGVSTRLAGQYILEYSPAIINQDRHAYLALLRMTFEGTEIERLLFQFLDCFVPDDINYILKKLEKEFGVNYLISSLSMVNPENVKNYITYRQTLFVGASENSLRNLLTLILVSAGKESPFNERVINDIAAVVARDAEQAKDVDDPHLETFEDAINLYLTYLPDQLKIVVMYGIYQAFADIDDYSFIYYLIPQHQNLFLRAKATVIASDFSLEEMLNLCHQRIKPKVIVNSYSGRFEATDIALFERLIRERKVTKSEVKLSVMRSFKKYIEDVPKFIICDRTNTFLILLSKYLMTEFRKYVRPEFKKMVIGSGGIMKTVARFPAEVRLEVLLTASDICSVREIQQLNDEDLFPARYNQKQRVYLKRLLKRTERHYTGSDYLRAVFALDPDTVLAYCSSLKDLRAKPLSTYLGVTADNKMRVTILCRLARHVSVTMYRNTVNSMLVLGSAELRQMKSADFQPDVKKLVESQLRDYRLIKRLSERNVLTAEDLRQSEHESLQIHARNPEYKSFFQWFYNADAIIKSMTQLLETERFEFIMGVAKEYDTLLIHDPENRVTKVQAMISLLPMPYQRIFADKVVLLFNSNEQITRVASAIAHVQERQRFIDSNQITPKVSVVHFGAFKPKRDTSSSAEPPNKAARVYGKKA